VKPYSASAGGRQQSAKYRLFNPADKSANQRSKSVEYVKDYAQHRVEIERTHLLPCDLFGWALAGGAPENALDTFIDARLDLLLERLRKYLDGIPFEVVDTRSTTKERFFSPRDLMSQGKEPTALRESVLQIGAEGGSVTIYEKERQAMSGGSR